MITERDIPCAMRDGVVLRADVFRPEGAGPFPVLLQRMPYDKAFMGPMVASVGPLTEAGYIVALQDTRGRYASEGVFEPFRDDREDGYDTVAWAARLPGADGRVGMFGGSYMGYTQWAAAAARPPALAALAPMVAHGDRYGHTYWGGAFQLLVFLGWALSAAADETRRRGLEVPEVVALHRLSQGQIRALVRGDLAEAGQLQGEMERFLLEEARRLPLDGYGPLREAAPFFAEWLRHPYRDAYWGERMARPERLSEAPPSLNIAGWFDIFVDRQLDEYAQLREAAGPEGGRRHRLIVGPWAHTTSRMRRTGEMDCGPDSVLDLVPLYRAWFGHWLKGEPLAEAAPVRLFVMGANRWRDEETWPLARAVPTDYFLHSGGRANTLGGDGTLSRVSPAGEERDQFVDDPRDPVPTHGGAILNAPAGVFDQREVEGRADVLVYTSAPLDGDLEVTGPVRMHLWAATDGPGTDFTAKLVDVRPDGYAANLCDGILRSTHREGDAGPARTEPGVAYEYVIELGPTSNVFRAGHRIRVEVSSSNFPRFDRNPNTGVLPASAVELRPARQTVFHEPGRASRVVLPVVRG
jgi:putative CocE/NonD family hydrolase